MNKAEQVLAASIKAWERQQEESAFSDRSESVRGWEPRPTRELAAYFKPKRTPSMYETVRAQIDGEVQMAARDTEKFRTY